MRTCVAEPSLLKDPEIVAAALRMHRGILDRAVAAANRKDEEFKVLRKGLGYTLSVVVCALPREGFDLMRRLVETGDSDLRWIVEQNLKKNRLIRSFPAEVERVHDLLT